MKKNAWLKEAALLCGVALTVPFTMGIALVPQGEPIPAILEDGDGDSRTFLVEPPAEETPPPAGNMPYVVKEWDSFYWGFPDPQEELPVLPLE